MAHGEQSQAYSTYLISKRGNTMIQHSKQAWEVGKTVRVGFMTLTVSSIELTPGDYKPDVYHLVSSKGIRYRFTPHYGLEREC